MKILVLSGRYAWSGVPLAQLRFAKSLAAEGHVVELIYGDVNEGFSLPDIENVQVKSFHKQHVSSMLFDLIGYLKKERPEIIFSAGDHLNAVILFAAILSGSKSKISCSSRVTPFDTYSNKIFSKPWFLKKVMQLISWRADVLTCVSEDMVKQYNKVFKNTRHQCIYNIIVDEESKKKSREVINEPWFETGDCPKLIAAGALEHWKGFQDLIHAITYIQPSQEGKLLILGDGPLKKELQALISELNLENSIKLAGFVQNPLSYFKKADIFVLSSHVEGLPNVLVEAMMCGCTPVSTNCPTGPREVLNDGKFGYLAPVHNPIGLSKKILEAIDSPTHSELLDEAILPFSEKIVISKHFESLLI